MTTFRKARAALIVCAAALVCLLTFGAPRASADSITFTLGTPNTAISGFTGPYVQVTVNRTSTTMATITFTSLTAGGNIYLMGDGQSADLNVNATSFTLGAITGTNTGTGFTPGPYSQQAAGTVDGFGTFNLRIDSMDGFSHSADTITFTLTSTGGPAWNTASAVLTPNSGGSTAAAHVFVTSSPANAANGALGTGFAANGALVPEPASMGLLGTALLGAYALLRRKLLA